jgi:RHS repeat-associated protein
VGLAKSVVVMPGDQISVSAYAKYANLSAVGNSNSLLLALASAFGTSAGATGVDGKLYTGLEDFAGSVPLGDHPLDDDGIPKAFVTILLFDNNYNLLDATWDQITSIGAQTDITVKQPPHDLLSATYKVKEAGFAYIFLSNEHPKFVDVYFDDVSVVHTPSQIVSASDYYPFGLTFNSYSRENSVPQDLKFNGKEEQKELDLGWLDFGARMYMPDIARWGVIDPMAAKYPSWSPYNFSFNNPVRFIDPDGRDPKDTNPDKKANRLEAKLEKQVGKINAMAKSMSAGGFSDKEKGKIEKAIGKANATVNKLNNRLDKLSSTATGLPSADKVQLAGGFDSRSRIVNVDFSKNGGKDFKSMQGFDFPQGNLHITSSSVNLIATGDISVTASDNVTMPAADWIVGQEHSVGAATNGLINQSLTGPLSPIALNANPATLQSPSAGIITSSNSGTGSVSGTINISFYQEVSLSNSTPPIQ